MTKQEQIEKMANCSPCYERYGKCPLKDKTTCNRWTRAVNQYEQGYRKIPEDAVLLTKEECDNKVILNEDHFERALNYEREKARKETAKEILTYLWKQRNVIGQLMIFEEDLIKLARQYGVEVEE